MNTLPVRKSTRWRVCDGGDYARDDTGHWRRFGPPFWVAFRELWGWPTVITDYVAFRGPDARARAEFYAGLMNGAPL